MELALRLDPLDLRVLRCHTRHIDHRFAIGRTADAHEAAAVGHRASAQGTGKVQQLGPHARTIWSVPASANAPVLVEVAVDSVAGAKAAAGAGAHRLELCVGLGEGGLTPSVGLLAAVRAVAIPVMVMLRPRGGDFLYDEHEFDVMTRDLEHLRLAGADGFVFGLLTRDGRVDVPRLRALIAAAAPLPVTFHRAIDVALDAFEVLDTLAGLGIHRVLTSGQAETAIAGQAMIRALVAHADRRIHVMAGAGLRDTNVRQLVDATGVREVHLSATAWQPSAMTFSRPHVPMGSVARIDETMLRTTDGAMVARVVAALAAENT